MELLDRENTTEQYKSTYFYHAHGREIENIACEYALSRHTQQGKLELERLVNFVQTFANPIVSFSVIEMTCCAPPYTVPAGIAN